MGRKPHDAVLREASGLIAQAMADPENARGPLIQAQVMIEVVAAEIRKRDGRAAVMAAPAASEAVQ